MARQPEREAAGQLPRPPRRRDRFAVDPLKRLRELESLLAEQSELNERAAIKRSN